MKNRLCLWGISDWPEAAFSLLPAQLCFITLPNTRTSPWVRSPCHLVLSVHRPHSMMGSPCHSPHCTDPTAWWGLPISWLFTLHWLQNLPSQQIIPHDLFISRTLTLVHLQRHLFKLMSNCRFLELGLGHIYFGEHNSTYDTLFLPNSHSSHILNIFTPSQHLQNFQLLHIRSLSKNLTYISSALISKSNMGDSTVHPGAEFLSNFVKSEKWAISRYRGGCSYLKEEKMWKLERAPEFLFCSDIWGSGKLHSILTS